MANIDDARTELIKTFISNWSTTDIAHDNESYDPPSTTTEYVRISIRHLPSAQDTLGPENGRRYLRRGLIIIQVFVQADTNMQRTSVLCQQILDIFEGKHFTYCWTKNSNIREGLTDGRWFQTSVEIEFNYEQTK